MPPKKPKAPTASPDEPAKAAKKKPAKKKPASRAKAAEKTTERKAAAAKSPAARRVAAKAATAKTAAKPAARPTTAKRATAKAGADKKPVRAKSPVKKTRKSVAAPEPSADPNEARRDKTREIAKWVAIAAIDKKAERIEIIDLADKVDYADFFVLMTGRSDRQTQAIAQGITQALTARGVELKGTEGMSEGNWVLLDFGDVVAHVFLDESRKLYDLEGAWMDARRIPYEGAALPSLPPPPPND